MSDPQLATPSELVRRVARTLRRRFVPAAAILVLTIAGALAVTAARQRTYSATAQILLAPSDAVGQLVSPGTLPSPANAQRDVDTNAKLITSHPVLERVRQALGTRSSDDELAAKVAVSGQTESSLVSITATEASAAAARRLAAVLAQEYARYRRDSAREAVRQAIAAGRARLAELGGGGAERAAVRERLAELETNAAVTTGGVQIVHLPGFDERDLASTGTLADAARRTTARAQLAAVPGDLTPRKLVLTAAAAGFVGAVLALAAAFALEACDRRLRSVEDVEAALAVPVLGCLPARGRRPGRDGAPGRSGDTSLVDAYADVTTSLGFAGAGGPRTLMISPVGSGLRGATFVARVATQLAALRRRVLVVDANVDAGAGAGAGGGARSGGLTSLLAGDSTLTDEIAVVHVVSPPAALRPGDVGDVMSYELLPAGEPVGNPAALLGRPALAAILCDALARADVVLLDAPGPVPVGRSAPLAALSDRVVLLVALDRTTSTDAAAARRAFGALYERVLGVVVLGSERPSRLRRARAVPAIAPAPVHAEVAATNGHHEGNGVWPPAAGRERV